MRATFFSTFAFALTALAAPTQLLARQAGDLQAIATVGYATTNGGTTGGRGGLVVSVSTKEELEAAAAGTDPKIILVTGKITSTGAIKVGSNKSVIGAGPTAELVGCALSVKGQKNVIIRNLKISKVLAPTDAISLQTSSNIWIDHLDLSSDMTHGKDFYDGLLDITHAVEWVTISNTKLHDHYKASLVGHSDNNAAEDTGKLHVTYVNNYWLNINSRGPSIRFGTGHIFNNVFEKVVDGINVRKGAKVLVENNVWSGASKPLYSVDSTGGVTSKGNDFGGATATLTTGGLTTVPYTYTAVDIAGAAAGIKAGAGNSLSFSA